MIHHYNKYIYKRSQWENFHVEKPYMVIYPCFREKVVETISNEDLHFLALLPLKRIFSEAIFI